MLQIVGKQPAFQALVHHGGRDCKMQRGRTAVSERFRIQLPFNGCRVIDDLQARAGGEPADIAWMLWRWRMMQKFRGICFYDSVNIVDTQLALIGKQPIGGRFAFEKSDGSFDSPNSADKRSDQQRDDAEMRDKKCEMVFAPGPARKRRNGKVSPKQNKPDVEPRRAINVGAGGFRIESSFHSKIARAYVYGAPWFNIWLVLLGANLAVSALSRWPWRKHHLAFLITHLGIITLLIGSLIGRIWGIEGTITLFKGEPPTNRLLADQRELRVHDVDGIVKAYPAEFLHHPPTPQHPRNVGRLASGARLQIVDYATAIEGKLNPKSLADGGSPAPHFTILTAMMNQRLESWLLADDPQPGNFSMGLANIEFKRGAAPT